MLSHTIVQKLNGLKYISPLLQSSNTALQNSAVALLGNLSRSTRTNKVMGKLICAVILLQGSLSLWWYCFYELHHGCRSVMFSVLVSCYCITSDCIGLMLQFCVLQNELFLCHACVFLVLTIVANTEVRCYYNLKYWCQYLT